MSQQEHEINHLPLHLLFKLLEEAGFDLGAATIIDIQKVLAQLKHLPINNFAELKTILAPVICRNKEEQEEFYTVFAKFQAIVEQPLKLKEKPVTTEDSKAVVIQTKKKYKKWIPIGITAVVMAGVLIFILINNNNKETGKPPALKPSVSIIRPASIVVNTLARFDLNVKDTSNGSTYQTALTIGDTTFQNTRVAEVNFHSTETTLITAILYDDKKNIIATDTAGIYLHCEKMPIVQINTVDNAASPLIKKYTVTITNPAKDSSKYRYSWYINDTLKKTGAAYTYENRANRPYKVKVKVDAKGLHCDKLNDSLVTEKSELPALTLTAAGITPLTIEQPTDWKKIWAYALLIFIPLVPAYYTFRYFRRKRKKAEAVTIIEQSPAKKIRPTRGPYAIDFADQDNKIRNEDKISQLADILRKRQVSDHYRLNIKKSIQKTIRSAGFPYLQFSPYTKPTDFLFFLDKEYPDSHQVKLFEFIIKKLQGEQVNCTTYEYYKEPLQLNNQKRNHHGLSLDKVAQLYPNTILFIFGNADYFFQPFNPEVKSWVKEKFRSWDTKLIITPHAKADWDHKEVMLYHNGFTIIPADLEVQQLINSEVHKTEDRAARKKLNIPEGESTRFDLNEFSQLKKYLKTPELINWVSALAVYPKSNWKFTIAIGKAIEDAWNETHARKISLVNYSNLLTIARINWLQGGVIPENIRLDLLKNLDNNTEAIARDTLLKLLLEIKKTLKEDSLIKKEIEVQETTNRFLLRRFRKEKPLEEEDAAMKKIYKNNMDWSLQVYLEGANDTLLKDPERQGMHCISPGTYFEISDQKITEDKILQQQKNKRLQLLYTVLQWSLPVLLYATLAGFFYWGFKNTLSAGEPTPVNLNFSVAAGDYFSGFSNNVSFSLIKSQQGYPLKRLSDSTAIVEDILINDSTEKGRISVQSGFDILTTTNEFPLQYSHYRLSSQLMTAQPMQQTQVIIRYRAPGDRLAAENMALLLGEMFVTRLQNIDFTDSAHLDYFRQAQKPRADSLIQLIKEQTGLLVTGNYRSRTKTGDTDPVIYLNAYGSTRPPSTTLEPGYNEIWQGSSNNRLLTINVTQKIIYYSTGGKITFGTYRIAGTYYDGNRYRVITQTNQGYRVFFIAPNRAGNFNLSVCPPFYRTWDEAYTVTYDNCGNSEPMTPYYETSRRNIYVPVDARSYAKTEEDKVNEIMSPMGDYGTGKATLDSINVYVNTANYTGSTLANRQSYIQQQSLLRNYGQKPWNKFSFRGTPFDRDYIRVVGKPVNYDPENNPAQQQPPTGPQLRNRTVLWVDDNPYNNQSIVDTLKALGAIVVLKSSNNEALDILQKQRFDLIISDISRDKEGSDAGIQLIDAVRKLNSTIPFVFYTMQREVSQYDSLVKEKGASGITSDPDLLQRVVIDKLRFAGAKSD